jgi:hypothetical protein
MNAADNSLSGKHQSVPGNPLAAYSDVVQDVTKNVFYWSRVAVIVAQGSGMHRRYVSDSKH